MERAASSASPRALAECRPRKRLRGGLRGLRAEAALRAIGVRQCRVRHYGDTARIEVEPEDLVAVVERRAEIVAGLRACGYRYVTLDLEGFRSGNLNQALS